MIVLASDEIYAYVGIKILLFLLGFKNITNTTQVSKN
jgi:hypothetical protein